MRGSGEGQDGFDAFRDPGSTERAGAVVVTGLFGCRLLCSQREPDLRERRTRQVVLTQAGQAGPTASPAPPTISPSPSTGDKRLFRCHDFYNLRRPPSYGPLAGGHVRNERVDGRSAATRVGVEQESMKEKRERTNVGIAPLLNQER